MAVLFRFCLSFFVLTAFLSHLECFILETIGIASVGYVSYKVRCSFMECCIDDHIPYNLQQLKDDFTYKLFGQPLAYKLISILEGHKAARGKEDHNALAISLHGWPGTGKNFVSNLIAKALFKYPESKYVKMYSGASAFPGSVASEKYKLQTEIVDLVKSCGRALIIFDEVNDIPPGILDAIKPMLDFHPKFMGVSFRDTVFLFLSNLDGDEITNHFLAMNKPRDEVDFSDFEPIIREKAYKEEGGFQDSRLLYSHLIDHFIPFLPLEQVHVEKCINEEFKSWGVFDIKQEYIDAAMSVITFGPKQNPIFSNSGCKRIRNQVAHLIKHLSIPHQVAEQKKKSFFEL